MFGISNSVKENVQVCTSEKLNEALDSPQVTEVCGRIAHALDSYKKGEMSKDDFEALKSRMKKQLPILTPHATFKNGRRKNDEAIPSGLSMYDKDHISTPVDYWKSIEPRKEELGIVMAHVTPSTEGLRLIFVVPQGMNLAEAQAWMASQLGDEQYDACVKDYARSSFVVPRKYVLYMDEEKLFAPRVHNDINKTNLCQSVESVANKDYPQTYEGIPYSDLVEVLTLTYDIVGIIL